MIYEPGREGYIEDIDAYHAARGVALASVKAPPPSERDRAQLTETYADLSPSYDWDHPYRNIYCRAAFYWSETLYTAAQLREILPPIIPAYNAFNGVETVEQLAAIYPEAFFLPGREHSPVIYVYSVDGSTLRTLNEREKGELAVGQIFYYPIQRLAAEVTTYILRLWWA